MLHALLKNKLGRAIQDETDFAAPASLDCDTVSRLEDPLTSTVFERLRYLDPVVMWALLGEVIEPMDRGQPWPSHSPAGAPSWELWPRWEATGEVRNTRLVEPDVVARWPDGSLFLFEAKHWGLQSAGQWEEQIRAARTRFGPGLHPITLVAVGGVDTRSDVEQVAALLRKNLQPTPRLFRMRWEDLCAACEKRVPRDRLDLHGSAAVLADLAMGLRFFGRAPKVFFDTLPRASAVYQTSRARWSGLTRLSLRGSPHPAPTLHPLLPIPGGLVPSSIHTLRLGGLDER